MVLFSSSGIFRRTERYSWTASVVVVLSDVLLPDCATSADMTDAADLDVQLCNVLEFFDRLQTER